MTVLSVRQSMAVRRISPLHAPIDEQERAWRALRDFGDQRVRALRPVLHLRAAVQQDQRLTRNLQEVVRHRKNTVTVIAVAVTASAASTLANGRSMRASKVFAALEGGA